MSENKDVRISPNAIHGEKTIGVTIKKYNQLKAKSDKLEKDLEYSRGQLETTNKYWDKIRIERNSFLLEKESLEKDVKELKDKIDELETDLYFERRNRRISEMYDGS